jgi:hypothetical protein
LTGRGRYNQEAIPFLNERVESWGDEDHGCGGSDSAHLDIGAVTISAIYHLFPILQKSEDLISICSPGIYDFLPVIQYQVIFLNDCIFQFVKLSFSAAKISVEIH